MKQEYLDDCPDYVKSFLTNLTLVRDRGSRTEEAYYIDLRTFLRYLMLSHGDVPRDSEFSKIKIAKTIYKKLYKYL